MQRVVAQLDPLIDGKEELVPDATRIQFKLDVKEVPDRKVLLARERTDADGAKEVIPRLIMEMHGELQRGGGYFVGPPLCVCPFPGEDGTAELAVGWPVPDDFPGGEILRGGRALVMEHKGPMDELGRSYRLMGEAMHEHGFVSAGDPVEVYVTNPEEVSDPNNYVTIIEWPVGPEGELGTANDYFVKRIE